MKNKEERSLKDNLTILLKKSHQSPNLLIEEILEILSGKGPSLILIFLSLPFCQPIQIPGLSTPFGILIALIGLRTAFWQRIGLPKRVLTKTIRSTTIEKITQKSLNLMNKMKRFMHIRIVWLCNHRAMKICNGLLIFFLGIFLALPLPIPLTNLAPGWSIFLLNLGLLESDGVFVIVGYLASLLTFTVYILILFSFRVFL